MAGETARLAAFAAELQYQMIPQAAIRRAKDCIADTVAAMLWGSAMPWSRTICRYAAAAGAAGRSAILAPGTPTVHPAAAALANGAMAHAFEQDCLTHPSAGSHPGATLVPPVLAAAQHVGASGQDAVLALVAGMEVLNRIGRAGANREAFHKPGLIGPFGAAVAVGRLLRLDADRMANAIGIAGSLGGGLLEFSVAGSGAMVKRLHLGRASESGVLAALLAADGFTGPLTVLEGEAGFLAGYCDHWSAPALVAGLGETWETMTLSLKRFACHITAHLPIQIVLDLRAAHGFIPDQIEAITVHGNARMAGRNNIAEPADLMMAQYSIPFCVALGLLRDPLDPASFTDAAVADPAIRDLCRRVSVVTSGEPVAVEIRLRDSQRYRASADTYPGMPSQPLTEADMKAKFLRVAGNTPATSALCDRLQRLEAESDLHWLSWPG
jgi:2-methylcitrate dehydratase PrpD